MTISREYAFSDVHTLTRASAAWGFDSSGALTEFASGTARAPTYDPTTLALRGLLLEPAATNLVRNPRCEGAVAGTPGTIPTTGWFLLDSATYARRIVGLATERNIPCVDVEWTVAAGAAATNIIFADTPAAAAGTAVVGGYYLRVVSGAAPQFRFVWQDGVATVNRSYFTVSSALTRYTDAYTTAVGGTLARCTLGIAAAPAGAVFVLRIGAPQVEPGAVATTPNLPPAAAPAASTRAADDLSGANLPLWWSADAGTWILTATLPAAAPSSRANGLLRMDDGTADEAIRLENTAGGSALRAVVRSGGADTATLAIGSMVAGTEFEIRLSYGPAGVWASLNGAAPVSVAATMPANLSRVLYGRSSATAGADTMAGWLRAVRYYPVQLTSAVAAAPGLPWDGKTLATV